MSTLTHLIANTIDAARAAGYDGTDRDYTPTQADCESIVRDLGRKPSREEWARAGYPDVGGAHVFGWVDVTDAQVARLRAEAASAGDSAMVAVCDAAQDDDTDAQATVVRVLADAASQE